MAEVTGLRNNALPYPIYGAPFGITFPLLDADGDPVTGATGDSERSLNGDTFSDCTNEAVEIATSSGSYYLLLTAAEMTADVVTVQVKSGTSKTSVFTLFPRKLVTIRSGTAASAGSLTSTIVLDASASALDDFYNGMVCIATIDSNVEVRIISDYVGSTKSASVVPDWNVAPDNNDTFIIALPEGAQVSQANLTAIAGVTVSTSTAQLGVNVVNAGGTAWASGSLTSGVFASGAITATAIAADAIGASELAADAVAEIADAVWDEDATAHQTQGTFGQAIGDPAADTNTIFKATVTDATGATVGVDIAAVLADTGTDGVVVASINSGAITATSIAADAIGASELAADAATEIATAVWATATRSLTVLDEDSTTLDLDATIRSAVGLASANLDTQIGDIPTNAELATSQASADDATLAAIAALNNISAAQVNAEVVDALATDTYAEPGQGTPSATTTLAAKINYLYKAWRNKKEQTATTHSLYNDAGSVVDQKSTVSDDATTATRGKIATGP